MVVEGSLMSWMIIWEVSVKDVSVYGYKLKINQDAKKIKIIIKIN
jgi:hypothetical protein